MKSMFRKLLIGGMLLGLLPGASLAAPVTDHLPQQVQEVTQGLRSIPAIPAMLSPPVQAPGLEDAVDQGDVSSTGTQTSEGKIGTMADPVVAILRIFADSAGANSSTSISGHAFITVHNYSNSKITIGKLSGIAPGRTVSLGTWGNKWEHNGLWYNLEAYLIAKNGAYSGRISVSASLTAKQLSTLNTKIINSDSHNDIGNNCASFAASAWNIVVASPNQFGSGLDTPVNLYNEIKKKFPTQYRTGYAVPYNYRVYYARGTGTPKLSTVYK